MIEMILVQNLLKKTAIHTVILVENELLLSAASSKLTNIMVDNSKDV